MKYISKLNKLPYILWFTNPITLDFDFEKKIATNEDGLKTNIKEVSPKLIFLIKYLPLLLIFFLGLKIPNDLEELSLFAIGTLVAFIMQYIFVNFMKTMKKVIIGLTLVMYASLYFGYAYEMEQIILYMLEVLIVFFFYREFMQEKYKGYYHLQNYERKATVTMAKKKKRPILRLWGERGFFKVNTGFNASKELSIGGFFVRIDKEVQDV
ncbi:MAG: hypothetical protein L3J10_04290 [Sulfurimonas sp.]|nr:hypothetical protein [Sulfurimonas sp.]